MVIIIQFLSRPLCYSVYLHACSLTVKSDVGSLSRSADLVSYVEGGMSTCFSCHGDVIRHALCNVITVLYKV